MTDPHYYELRIYEVAQSRLLGLRQQMEKDVPPIFRRLGFNKPLVKYQGVGGPFGPIYGYVLRWANLDERMQAWDRFYADPEWIGAMQASYQGEQRVERSHISILRASPTWSRFRTQDNAPVGGIYELRRHDCSGQPREAATAQLEAQLAELEQAGATVLGVLDTVLGGPMQRSISFVAWPDARALARHGGFGHVGAPAHESFILRPTEDGCAQSNLAAQPW
jgi:hypothetical protein